MKPKPEPQFDSERLDRLMRARGISETALANLIGVKQPSVGRYRRGKSTPESRILVKLSDWSGITVRAWMMSDK